MSIVRRTSSPQLANMRWEDFNWATERLTVYADVAKTREPRSVSLPRELIQRLAPYRQTEGPLYHHKSFYRLGPKLAARAGIVWKRNIWRKSAISHLYGLVRDLGRVASEAGNSPAELRRSYLKDVDPQTGNAWFGLTEVQRHPLDPGYRFVNDQMTTKVPDTTSEELPSNVIRLPTHCLSSVPLNG